MNTQNRFTKIDVLITVLCLVLLAVNLPVISSSGRTHAKMDVCMANLRQLTAAWQLYAEDNGGKLVNGAPTPGNATDPRRLCDSSYNCACSGINCNYKAFAPIVCADEGSGGVTFCYGTPLIPWHQNELPWVGPAWGNLDSFYSFDPAPEDCQKCAIGTGALFKYVRQYNIYKCPVGKKGELLSYSIMDGMNGMWKYRTSVPANQATVMSLCYKKMGAIKNASERAVFIDEGYATCDSYACYYDRTQWFDFPPVRHGNGTTVSYADGHAEWWKYRGIETVKFAKIWDSEHNVTNFYNPATGTTVNGQYLPASCLSLNDLYKMQVSCWGSVGYTNPMPGCELSSD